MQNICWKDTSYLKNCTNCMKNQRWEDTQLLEALELLEDLLLEEEVSQLLEDWS